jgi:hypothetical protein
MAGITGWSRPRRRVGAATAESLDDVPLAELGREDIGGWLKKPHRWH